MRRRIHCDDTHLGIAADIASGSERRPASRFVYSIVSLVALCLAVIAPLPGFAASEDPTPQVDTVELPPSSEPAYTLLIGPGEDDRLTEPSRLSTFTRQVRASVSEFAVRTNAVVLPRWHGPRPERKYKQSTLFEMHSELGDSGTELALRVSLKQKRFIQFEFRF